MLLKGIYHALQNAIVITTFRNTGLVPCLFNMFNMFSVLLAAKYCMLKSQVIQLASRHPNILPICSALPAGRRCLALKESSSIGDVAVTSNSVDMKIIEVAKLLPIRIPQKVLTSSIKQFLDM